MGADQFGYQLQELGKIQHDWQTLHQQMDALTKQLGSIKGTIEQAAAVDVFSSVFSGLPGFGAVAGDVVGDVRQIEARADQLKATKEQLTKELADDAQKIKAVISEYEAAERKIEEEWRKHHSHGPAPKSPQPGGGGTGGHGGGGGGPVHGGGHGPVHHPKSPGGGGGGDTGGGGGGGDTGPVGGPGGKHDGPHLRDLSTGDWKTHFINGYSSWDGWSDHAHPTNGHGDGVLAQPKLDGLSDERKAIVERGLERAEHKLGYSQAAVTNGYRVDCSGLVSCAWGIPGPGMTTWDLEQPSVSHHITKDQLTPGDALVCNTPGHEHVVLFGGWADPEHTKFICIEDAGSHGCVSRELPYPYPATGPYKPIRKNGVE
jgi:hypothetical protein